MLICSGVELPRRNVYLFCILADGWMEVADTSV